MKVIILAGGHGTRLSEETDKCPKPLVEIGSKPILWHIMKLYEHAGFNDFVIACGYKGDMIKEYFHNFYIHNNDYLVHLHDGTRELLKSGTIDWKVAAVDTGLNTMTGGRIKKLAPYVGNSTFMVTYGDGVGDVDIYSLLKFHRAHGKIATVTAVRPPARFGELTIVHNKVEGFSEKPQVHAGWINGGFFVFEPDVFNYIDGEHISLEREPLEQLSRSGELMAFTHDGFWHPMDTLREKQYLESLWSQGKAPWKLWAN